MVELAPGTQVAGVFTRNRCPGAPIDWCRAALAGGQARALVVNAGNANVFTGAAGRQATLATAEGASGLLGCAPTEIFLASTGVIGEVLPHARITAALPALHASLAEDAWEQAARGIMTTDTFPKACTRVVKLGGTDVRLTGFAKGSGMIAPDMATMLCFVFTDAALPQATLQALLHPAVDASFNRTTVDSDTSTSDTVLLFATGAAANPPDAGTAAFGAALAELLLDLALQVVRDGEGAQKLVRIDVTGATDNGSARRVALGRGQFAAGENRHRRAGRELGPHRHGRGQGWRTGRPRSPVGGRWGHLDGARWRRGAGLRRSTRGGAHAGPRNPDLHRSGAGARRRYGLDLRSDARLHRYQRELSQLTGIAAPDCPARIARDAR